MRHKTKHSFNFLIGPIVWYRLSQDKLDGAAPYMDNPYILILGFHMRQVSYESNLSMISSVITFLPRPTPVRMQL